MEADQKKNAILIGVAAILIVGAVVFGFRDSIFSSSAPATTVDDATAAAVAETMGKTNQPEPDQPNPPPRGSGKNPVIK